MVHPRPKLLVLTPAAAGVYAVLLLLAAASLVLANVLPMTPPWVDSDPKLFPKPLYPNAYAGVFFMYLACVLWALGMVVFLHQCRGKEFHIPWIALQLILAPAVFWLLLVSTSDFEHLQKLWTGILEPPILALSAVAAALWFSRRSISASGWSWRTIAALVITLVVWLGQGWQFTGYR